MHIEILNIKFIKQQPQTNYYHYYSYYLVDSMDTTSDLIKKNLSGKSV